MNTRRLRFLIAYDGTPWQGWQGQPNGQGIQNQVEAALAKIVGSPVSVQASGRTDTGVHALALPAHGDVPGHLNITAHGWVRAVNSYLPPTIRILSCEDAAPDFHARFHAQGKVYRYRIVRTDVMPPLEVDRAWHVHGVLDSGLLRACLSALRGTHNFARLSANRGFPGEAELRADPANTTRTIFRADLTEQTELLTIELEGDGFLYKMVRLIVGAAVQVARGRAELAWFTDLLSNPQGSKNNQCAPAGGLYLVRVNY
jgi:tRNA pseudouridine38-40 synthase